MKMKKTIFVLSLCVLLAMQTHAQSFEGIITWRSPDAGGKGDANLVLKVKGKNIVTVINGGMMNGVEMWFMNNDTKIMRVMRPQKMFAVVPPEAMAAAAKAVEVTKFVKTTETMKILQYTCIKYSGEMKQNGITTNVSIWTTTEIKDDQKVLMHQPDPFANPKLPEGVEGVPLKIEKTNSKGTTVLEVTDVKLEKLSDDLFKLPADFKEMGK